VTRAWTVRGGRYGEREQAALDEGLVILGWENLGDLSNAASIDEVSAALRAGYPGAGPRTIGNWAHQLWRFLKVMQVGDLVVMPQKYKPVIAIGRVTGGDEYRGDAPSELRHVRRVKWLNRAVERTAVGGDLRDSMGSFRTVSELSRHGAVERVQSLADLGTDPGYSGHVLAPASPDALKNEVDKSGTRQLSARDLIGLWGRHRRTLGSIELVGQGLAHLGLVVEPHFTTVQLDDLVTISNAVDWRSESAWIADKPIYLRVTWGPPSEGGLMYASDLVIALWNIELLYDFSLLLAHPAYQDSNLTEPDAFFTSGWRALERRHRLEARSVEHHSPLLFLAVIPLAAAGAAGIWAVAQTFEKVANFPLNRRKLKAEVYKAEADARHAVADARHAETEAESAEYQLLLNRREANITADRLRAQIQGTPIPIVDAELTDDKPAA
jgi:hypothetical protein